MVGYQPLNFKSQSAQKERQIQKSARRTTYPQIELPDDEEEINFVAGHGENPSSDYSIVNLPENGMRPLNQGQHGTSDKISASVITAGSISIDKICEESIELFMRFEEYKMKEIELIETVEVLEAEVKEIQSKSAELSSLLEAKRNHRA